MRPKNTLGTRSDLIRPSNSRGWTTLGCAFLLLGTHCAVYDESLQSGLAPVTEGDAGSAAYVPADKEPPTGAVGNTAGGSGTAATGSMTETGGTGGTLASEESPQSFGGAVNIAGGDGVGGMRGGTVGDGGAPSGGGDSSGGSAVAGASATDSNLSRGKPASADSQQTTKLHYAADANDGDRSTRWCAADYKLNHRWEVDLGESFSLSTLRILWEKDASYLFKVESSVDHENWSLVLDKTKSNSATANQQHSFVPGATGRYVRITVTGGLTTTIWASFYELDIFGH